MNNRFGKRRVTSLLLVLAMLVVSVVSLLPMTASADPVGDYASDIQDFGWQSLSDATQNDATTDLRFLFTIGSLDYDEVGFVFSTSNSAPTAGGAGTFTSTVVYSSVTANGKTYNADPGRFWVAVKLSSIPLANFEDAIYIRPFIKVGENYSYIDAASIDVLTALTLDKIGAAEDAIYDSSAPSGPYAHDNTFYMRKSVSEIRGENSFHPTEANPDGNDLWFEYSFFWNGSLLNWDQRKSEMMIAGFRNPEGKYRDFYYLYTNDGQSGDCPYLGHFDYSTYMGNMSYNCAFDLTSEGNGIGLYKAGWDSPISRASSPYIYDEESQTVGGWHRLGVRYHQEATVDNGKGGVVYSGYTELYIDGIKVWKVQTDMQGYWKNSKWNQQTGYGDKGKADLKYNDLLLWYAKTELEGGDDPAEWTLYDGLYYKDHDTLQVQSRMEDLPLSSATVYVGIADVCWTCGDGFAHPVSPASLKADGTINLGGNDYSTKIWYIYDN